MQCEYCGRPWVKRDDISCRGCGAPPSMNVIRLRPGIEPSYRSNFSTMSTSGYIDTMMPYRSIMPHRMMSFSTSNFPVTRLYRSDIY